MSAWAVPLVNGLWLVSLAVSGMLFVASQRLAGARWSAGLRRIPEALALTLPAGAAVLLVALAGAKGLLPWSGPGGSADAPVPAAVSRFLDPPFVLARASVVLALWLAFAWGLRRISLAQDRNRDRRLDSHDRLNRWSASFSMALAVTFTLGAWDWVLSFEPGWFSTIFAMYLFAGSFVQGIAAVTLAAVALRRSVGAAEGQFHDLGKMLFAFSTFWAYLWVCQYLLIWYGNLPDEVTYYLKRTAGPWSWLFGVNLAVNWAVPFLALLSARAKRNPTLLAAVAALLLAGRWLDLYVQVGPPAWPVPAFGPLDLLVTAGCVALAALLFARAFNAAPATPLNDPVLRADQWLRARHQERLEEWASGVGG